jgi:hypothetical protein
MASPTPPGGVGRGDLTALGASCAKVVMWKTNRGEDTLVSMLDAEKAKCSQGHIPDANRQIKIGLLIWALIWIVGKSVVYLTSSLPSSSYETVNLLLKALNCIVSIVLIVYTVRKWQWNLDDWGFTYDLRFWVALVVMFVYVGYFWYREGLPTDFGIQTVRQAITSVWEELISTVFFTLLLTKYFRTRRRLGLVSAKVLAVVISAIVFTLLHYGRWSVAEASVNTLSFIFYRAVYAFAGTFLAGLVGHGASNSQFMAFPLVLAFYGVIAFFNWRRTKERKT